MRRRFFLQLPILGAALQRGMVLKAIAAEQMPQRLFLPVTGELPGSIVELRRYAGVTPSKELLGLHGIQVFREETRGQWMAFPDLEARAAAWSSVASDPEWQRTRYEIREVSLFTTRSASEERNCAVRR